MECHKSLRIAAPCFVFAFLLCLSSCGSGNGTTSTDPAYPYGLAVSDEFNNRVLIYNRPLATNENASAVLGQPDFVTNYSGETFSLTSGLAKDSSDNLWVSSFTICAVQRFSPPFTNDMNSSQSLGPFPSCNLDQITANSIAEPIALLVGSGGSLWIADATLSRVMEFDPPLNSSSQATLEIGQSFMDFTYAYNPCNQGNGTGARTADTLCMPIGLTLDPTGNLWVADHLNSRVLEYTAPLSDGMGASLVLGQASGTALVESPVSATSLYTPVSVLFDRDGNLWVSDSGNNRVLEYIPPFSNDMAATTVIGQLDPTDGAPNQVIGAGPAANTLSYPSGLSFDSEGNLWVADSGNSRVLMFAPPFSTGMSASMVIGQLDFTHGVCNSNIETPDIAAANTLCHPSNVVAF